MNKNTSYFAYMKHTNGFILRRPTTTGMYVEFDDFNDAQFVCNTCLKSYYDFSFEDMDYQYMVRRIEVQNDWWHPARPTRIRGVECLSCGTAPK